MAAEAIKELEDFLELVSRHERKIRDLLERSYLTEQEIRFILDHTLVIPGNGDGL
ncbi:hypothetical protein ACH6EH_14600 [Paenibacillus sp. JSM ZJ436]|uniref:hypothetical protein n=1 Tax=Paenibacillus sp. JSM ZJ436 TaxID=3376190 RepID=UPI00379ABB75